MEFSMDSNNNYHQVAVLESRIDYLETELSHLNKILIECGFPEGIETLKLTAEELIEEKLLEETS
jgi:hypothetical protein